MDITNAFFIVQSLQDSVQLTVHPRLFRQPKYAWTDSFTGNVYLARKVSLGKNPYLVQMHDQAGALTDLGRVYDLEAVRGCIVKHIVQATIKQKDSPL